MPQTPDLTLRAVLARRLELTDEPGLDQRERRSPIFSCERCGVAGERLTFMSNGTHCCASCARGMADTFGYGAVGMRADDINSLN